MPYVDRVSFSELIRSTSCDKMILFKSHESFPRIVCKMEHSRKPKHFAQNIIPREAPDIRLTQECLPFTCDPFEEEGISECLRKDRS